MGRLDGKVAVVTGGGGLLGSAFCVALADEGATVLVNDVAAERAEVVASEIAERGGRASVVVGSVGSWDEGQYIIETCTQRYGRIDCLVNSAHHTSSVSLAELNEETFRRTIDSHVTGHFACTHHAVKQMQRQGGGSIVNLVSRAMQGLRGYSAYGAAKGAILSATFSWALELAQDRIRVNALSPAARAREPGEEVSLRMPWRREPGQSVESMRAQTPPPESVAPLVVYLASDASHWVSGQAIFLAGDSLALIRHPTEEGLVLRPGGWNVEDLDQQFREGFGPGFKAPSMAGGSYRWYEGVGAPRGS